ncbi:MAG: hypothetical protein JNJ54_33530 [Myxococcaceae bacterium]|nr:hypothetical protein [Myxococcaceae bacterium]
MISAVVAVLIAQTAVTAPPSPPPAPEPGPATVEAVKAPASEPAEVKAFALFVDRHLLTLDPDTSTGSFRLRQRERVFSPRDDDFIDAFKLVPEALALAQKAQENARASTIFQIVGLSAVGVGSALIVIAPVISASGVFIPLLIAGLVLDLLGLVAVVIALPMALSAGTQFLSAVATYNRGLLDLRPPSEPGLAPAPGGLTVPLP